VTNDINKLEGTFEKVKDSMKKVEVHIEKGAIDKVFEVDQKYDEFMKIVESSRYLTKINESLIYELYRDIIQLDNHREFPETFE
jgi:hypothetical protein